MKEVIPASKLKLYFDQDIRSFNKGNEKRQMEDDNDIHPSASSQPASLQVAPDHNAE